MLKVAEKSFVAELLGDDVTVVVCENFDKLSVKVRNKLLSKLSENSEAAWSVRKCAEDNFDKIPENIQSELLLVQ